MSLFYDKFLWTPAEDGIFFNIFLSEKKGRTNVKIKIWKPKNERAYNWDKNNKSCILFFVLKLENLKLSACVCFLLDGNNVFLLVLFLVTNSTQRMLQLDSLCSVGGSCSLVSSRAAVHSFFNSLKFNRKLNVFNVTKKLLNNVRRNMKVTKKKQPIKLEMLNHCAWLVAFRWVSRGRREKWVKQPKTKKKKKK